MRKTAIALTAATAFATASITVPSTAEATPAWVLPAIIVGGVVAGGAIIANEAYAQTYVDPAPGGTVYVRPTVAPRSCYWARERVGGGWRRVRVCS